MKPKFTYVSYDYSFLRKKEDTWEILFPNVVKVAAKTIGFDMVETRTMDEPTGQLFWIDPIMTDEESSSAAVYTASTETSRPITNPWYDIYQYEKLKRNRRENYFKRTNFYNKLRHRKR